MTQVNKAKTRASQKGSFLLSKSEQHEDTRMTIGRLLAILKTHTNGGRSIALLEKIDADVEDMELMIARMGVTHL